MSVKWMMKVLNESDAEGMARFLLVLLADVTADDGTFNVDFEQLAWNMNIEPEDVADLLDELTEKMLIAYVNGGFSMWWANVRLNSPVREKVNKPARPKMSRTKRLRIIARHGSRCAYCQCAFEPWELEIDHVFPISLGGTNDDDNLRPACPTCNRKKGNREISTMEGGG